MDVSMWMSLQSAMQQRPSRPAMNRATLRRVAAFARPHRRRLGAFLALSMASATLGVASPVLAGRAVDAVVAGRPAGTVAAIAAVIAVLAVLDAGAGLLERLQSARVGEGLIFDLRRAVFDHVQAMPVAFFTRTRTGALVSRLNNDVIGAQRAFTSALSGVLTNALALTLTVAVMARLSWPITLLALVLLPIFVVPARRVGARVGQLEREAADHNAAMTSQMTERFSAAGAVLVKLFGRPADESADFALRARRVRDIGVRSAMAVEVFMRALTLVSGLAQALIYGLGGYLALRGHLAAGTVVTLALLLTRLYAPLTALATARLDVTTALVSFERVFEVLDVRPLIAESPGARPLPDGPVPVEFDDVRFAYPPPGKVSLASLEELAVLDSREGGEVLHGVSFRVEAGQTVALVGSSGAGKSTLASLVPRLYDVDSGAVRLAGVDVRDLTFASLHAAVGMVSQDGHLFHDTIGANLRYARPGASDAELWDALRRARLDELVASLPDGLDTVVGERGYRLSGGERQRLTIARLLLARPRVVMLDEATAHLDSGSEAAVTEALGEALAGRTALVIAHRLSTVRAADLILVIEQGTVVERGTHEQLLARDGRYAELYRTQFAGDPRPPGSRRLGRTTPWRRGGHNEGDAGPAGTRGGGTVVQGGEMRATDSRHRLLGAAVAVVLLALVAAACGGDGATKAAGGTSTSTPGGAPSTSSPAPSDPTTSSTGPGSNTTSRSGPTTTAALTPAFTAPPPAGATTVPVPTVAAGATATPVLRILSPKSGDVVAAPIAVQYAVSGFDVGPGRGGIQLTLGDGGAFGVTLPADGPSGVVYLDDKRLSGLRTLVFTLITADGRALTNPEATVRIPNVTLEGRK